MKIAIASGKGGTGKTFVSVNLFLTLRNMGLEAALIDCDAEAPNAMAFLPARLASETEIFEYRPVIDTEKCVFCGKCAEWCEYNAIICISPAKYIRMDESLCHGCAACNTACKYGAISDSQIVSGKKSVFEFDNDRCLAEGRTEIGIKSPVRVIKAITDNPFEKEYDYTILDSPPGTACPFMETVSKADLVLLVTEPTPFGLSDLKKAVNVLEMTGKPFGVIINRAGLGNHDVYDFLKEKDISLWGEIPFEREIAELCSEGKSIKDELPDIKRKFTELALKLEDYGNSRN
ncbi:MAG: ATP-binding protein [Bacteroidales bacterium]|jgi:MinD superfamily P-loop ATPase|nr:ATP-binding protein [Bacteroidales bacterium]MCI1784830.1 ATP-binding protein [Bacteroidales bacterium]